MRLFLCAILLSCGGSNAAAQIESYASLERIWEAELSPDGVHLATGCSPRGEREICIYNLANNGQPVVLAPPRGGRIIDFFWPSPTHLIYRAVSTQRLSSNEGRQGLAIYQPLSYSLETQNTVPLMAQARIASVLSNEDNKIAMMLTYDLAARNQSGSRLRVRNDFGTVVYAVDLDSGQTTNRIETSSGSTVSFVMNSAGEKLLDIRYDEDTGSYKIFTAGRGTQREIFHDVFPASRPRIQGLTVGETAIAIRFPRIGLRRMDISTGQLSMFEEDGIDTEFMSTILDTYAGTIVGFRYTDDLPRQIFTDPELAGLHNELKQVLTEDSVTLSAWTPDRMKMVVIGQNAGQPAHYYLLDLNTGGLGLLDTVMALPEGQEAGQKEALTFTTSDGLDIPGYLTLPPGQTREDGPFPLIAMPHGGPQSRDTAEFDWWASYYASLGYAVFQPNFRGSQGYGTEFLEAGYGGFGTRMIEDIIEGAHYLQDEGIAREGGYCAAGASYGGYAVMMMSIKDQDRLACAISFAGVVDPFSMLARSQDDADTIRYWEQYMGSRFTSSDYQEEISPSDRMNEMRAPMLILHGDDDTTVPFDHFRQLQSGMANQDTARFIRMEGEDHYLGSPEARMTLLRESEAFLAEHLPVH